MAIINVKPGKKLARPTAARFIKSQAGTLGMEIAFSFMEPSTGVTESMNWVAWLSEKAMERSMDTLTNTLGFNGNDSCNAEGILTDPQALAFNVDVELVVEDEEYKGKYYPKIKWVNRVGGNSFADATPESIKSELSAIGFQGAFLAAKQKKDAEAATSSKVPF
jgi:hypothetical protein